MPLLQPVVPLQVPCKCCNTPASILGVVDFHKNCEDRNAQVLPPSGIPIYYHRCPACGFVFTVAFDRFTPDEFREQIYNDQYKLVDPDYLEARPRAAADVVTQLLGQHRDLRILDYGCGSGAMAGILRERGYPNIACYDPIVPEFSQRPAERFDCVFSFEVVEHSPTPRQTIAEMASLVSDPGMIVYTTLFQPAPMTLNWWYAAPRNGHISLFSERSIAVLAQSLGLSYGSFDANRHVLYRQVPRFANPWFGKPL